MFIKKTNSVLFSMWILLPLLFFFGSLHAQSYIPDIQKLSVEDGLSNRFVRSFYKDDRGFMWIATLYGLNRYDGYTFKQYTTYNNGLVLDGIHTILGQDEQELWFQNQEQIYILNLQTDSIQSFDSVFKENVPFSVKDIKLMKLYNNNMKGLWFMVNNTLYRYYKQRFEPMFTIPERSELSLLYANEQFFWLHSPEKIVKMSIEGEPVKETNLIKGTKVLGFDKDQNLWLFQPREKKLQITGADDTVQSLDLAPLNLPEWIYNQDRSNRVSMDPSNNLLWWYSQRSDLKSLFVLDPKKGIFIDLIPELKPLLSHRSTSDKRLYFTYNDQVWLAMQDGIFIVTLKKNKFTTLLNKTSEINSVRGMVTDKRGNLYVNVPYKRIHISTKNKKTTYEKIEIWFPAMRDKEGNLWFGSESTQLEKYDPLNGESQYYRTGSGIFSIFCDRTGRIWAGSRSGLYFLDPDTDTLRGFEQYNAFPQLRESTIYHFHEDKKGIWIGTSSGLYLLEPGKGITARYARNAPPPYHIPHEFLLHFHRDTTGIFWLASRGGGLIRLDPDDGTYRQFTTAEGLSHNIVYAVYEDAYNRLWLPSDYGLMLFDKKDQGLRTYFESDGIAHNEFNTHSHYRDDDNILYFGGLDGITVIDPENFPREALTPVPLRITGCKVLNGKTGILTDKTPDLNTSKGLDIRPSETSVILEFALLNYKQSRKNNYSYRIEGLDRAWTAMEGTNSLRLSRLPYGNYTLEVKGRDSDGIVSANELRIPIRVHRPFYLTRSFILSGIFVLALLIYGMFRWRLQQLHQSRIRLKHMVRERTREISLQKEQIEEQAEKLSELDRVKSRFFTNISHDLRTPLTLILGPVNQLLNREEKKLDTASMKRNLKIVQNNASTLKHLINDILDLSKLESNTLTFKKQAVELAGLFENTIHKFTFLAEQRSIDFSYRIEQLKGHYAHIDVYKVDKILMNLLSNAFKFTPEQGRIQLLTSIKNNTLEVVVEDSGTGIPEKDLPHVFDRYFQSNAPGKTPEGGSGVGLALVKELTTFMKGSISVESRVGKGTTFRLALPISEARESELLEKTAAETSVEAITYDHPVPVVKEGKKEHHILIVEDHPEMQGFIRGILEKYYSIAVANNGKEALGILESTSIDLVVSDIMMPVMDGFALLENIKQSDTYYDVPIIMLTALSETDHKLKALTIGADDYLTKPFDAKELLARAYNLIERYQQRKQIREEIAVGDGENDTITTEPSTDAQEVIENRSRHLQNKEDVRLIEKAGKIIEENLENPEFKLGELSKEFYLQERQLRTKIKMITGLSPKKFQREIALQKARKLLENEIYRSVKAVALSVGITNVTRFSTLYEIRFGKRPVLYFKDSGFSVDTRF